MGKKKMIQKPHATQSFEQLVANANREALKPYINEVFGSMANDLSQRIFRQQANLQTRVMALEHILKETAHVTETDIQEAVMIVEDAAYGYVGVSRAAKEGDLLRVSLRTRSKDQADWTEVQRRQISNLMNLGQPEGSPLSLGTAVVESALVGMSVGEAKVVILEDDFQVEMSIDRVSEKDQDENPNA